MTLSKSLIQKLNAIWNPIEGWLMLKIW